MEGEIIAACGGLNVGLDVIVGGLTIEVANWSALLALASLKIYRELHTPN